MRKIKFVAFDAWGTLFNEEGNSLLEAAHKIVKDLQLGMNREEFLAIWSRFFYKNIAFYSHNIRKTNVVSLNETFKALGVNGNAQKYTNFMIDYRWANSDAYPEVAEVVQSVKLPKCVISNIDNDTLHSALRKNRLTFKHIITSEMAKAYKPHPKIFECALELLGCDKEDVIFIGDSQKDDVVGGKNFGITTVWVNRNNAELEKGIPKPDYEIEDLRGVLKILNEIN